MGTLTRLADVFDRATRDTAAVFRRISDAMDPSARQTEPQTIDAALLGTIATEPVETVLPGSESGWTLALTDEEVSGALGQLIDRAISRPWRIEPGRNTAQGKAAADWLKANLRSWGSANRQTFQTFPAFCRELAERALVDLTAIAEPLYWRGSDSRWWIDWAPFRDQDDFTWYMDRHGQFEKCTQSLSGQEFDLRSLLIAPWRPRGNSPLGRRFLRPVWQWHRLKEEARKAAGIYVIRAASGVMIGRYPSHWSDAQVALLRTLLARLSAETYQAIEQGASIEHLRADVGPAEIYERIIEVCDRKIRRYILAGVVAGDWSGSSSSRASSEVSERFQQSAIDTLTEWLACEIQRGIVQRLCDLNYETTATGWVYPVFAFNMSPPLDVTMMSEALVRIANLSPARDRIPAEYIRQLGIPIIGDEPLGVAALEGAQPKAADGINPGTVQMAEGQAPRALTAIRAGRAIEAAVEPGVRALAPAGREFSRAVIASADSLRDAALWLNGHRAELNASLGTKRSQARALFREAERLGLDVPPRAMPDVSALRELWGDAMLPGALAAQAAMAEGERRAKASRARFADAIDARFIPTEAVNQIQNLNWERYGLELFSEWRDSFIDSLSTGLNENWTAEQMADDFMTRTGQAPTTGGPESNWMLRRDVRVALNEVYNNCTLAAVKTSMWADGVEYMAILDPLTTPYCQEHDGWFYRIDDPRLAVESPPIPDHACRSMLIAASSNELDIRDATGHKFENEVKPGFRPPPYREELLA